MNKKEEITALIVIELLVLFGVGIFLGNVQAAFTWTLSYFFLFYFAFILWVVPIPELTFLEKYSLINFLGLGIIPTLYFLFGLFGLKMTEVSFLSFPIIIFLSGIIYLQYKHRLSLKSKDNKEQIKKEEKKPERNEDAPQ